jgi:hypothetical protein
MRSRKYFHHLIKFFQVRPMPVTLVAAEVMMRCHGNALPSLSLCSLILGHLNSLLLYLTFHNSANKRQVAGLFARTSTCIQLRSY